MVWLRRIGFFLLLNFTVMLMVGIITSVLGLNGSLYAGGMDVGVLMTFCLIWGMAGAFISLAVSRIAAKWTLGVKVIDPNTINPQERTLLNMVTRLSNSAGLPKVPEVGIYESPEVNAFATGPTKRRSLVAVSTGLLSRMDRDAIEGVLGHEISHVANGDMVTMTLLQGVVNAFVMALARIIAFAIDSAVRGNNDRGRGLGYFGQYLAVMILQTLLMIPGSMVIASFSRYREFRADAGGAKLAGRGKMIGALRGLKQLQNLNANPQTSAQPAYASTKITVSGASKFSEFFSSHPPLELRIARLETGA